MKNKHLFEWTQKAGLKRACRLLSLLPAFALVFLASQNAFAEKNNDAVWVEQQKQEVSGVVTDETGATLPGVSVLIKGTIQGVITDFDGKYSIEALPGSTLVFSFVGMKTQEVVVNNQKVINVTLATDNLEFEEVVVTALGIKKKEKSLSYNVQKIKQEDLVQVKDANFMNSLSGKVAGVTINRSSSGVGGATRVVMRGAKSMSGNNNALYVIDGVPIGNPSAGASKGKFGGNVSGEGISDINPEDIESISVLTGPSAAALYGSAAANGVVLINTKKGETGKLKVTVSSNVEMLSPFVAPKFQNRYGNKVGAFDSWGAKLKMPSRYNPLDFFQTGHNIINAVNMSVGTKKNQTFVSLASTNSQGIIPNNEYDRYNVTFRNTTSFLNDRMHMDLSASYVRQEDQNLVPEGLYFNPLVSVYLFPVADDFNKIKLFERFNPTRNIPTQFWPYGEQGLEMQNPYWVTNRMLLPSKRDRFMFYGNLKYDINSWLDVAGRVRMDNTYSETERKYYASTIGTFSKPKGYYGYSNGMYKQVYADFMVNINKYFGDDFNLTANVGASFEGHDNRGRGYKGSLLTVPNFFSVTNIDPSSATAEEYGGDGRQQNVAVFTSAELGWKNQLYLTLTGRNDWNSRLVNSSEPSFFYPSLGLSGIVTEMIDLPDFINFLKVRSSFTEVGSPITIGGATPGTETLPLVGGSISQLPSYPFPDFKAERTRSYEVGVNLRMFSNKLQVDATAYHSNTYNQTFFGSLPASSGYSGIFLQAGDVRNRGIELTASYNDDFGALKYSTNVTYTINENTILEMVKDYQNPVIPGEVFNITDVQKGTYNRIREGGSINDVYVNQFLKRDNQGYVYVSGTGDIYLDDNKPMVKIGSTAPDFNLGWRNSFSYKGVNLNILLAGRFGGIVTSTTQAMMDRFGVSEASAIARDNGGVLINGEKYDAEKYYKIIGGGDGLMGYYSYSATNIRLQQAALSYTFPKRWFNNHIQDITLSLIGTNLWMLYNKAPFDPELTSNTGTYNQGHDYFMQPSLSSFGIGLKFKF